MDYFECILGVQKFNMEEYNEKNNSNKSCDTIYANSKTCTDR